MACTSEAGRSFAMWSFTRSYASPIYLSLVCKRPCPGFACARGNGSLAQRLVARARGRQGSLAFFSNCAADGPGGLQTGLSSFITKQGGRSVQAAGELQVACTSHEVGCNPSVRASWREWSCPSTELERPQIGMNRSTNQQGQNPRCLLT